MLTALVLVDDFHRPAVTAACARAGILTLRRSEYAPGFKSLMVLDSTSFRSLAGYTAGRARSLPGFGCEHVLVISNGDESPHESLLLACSGAICIPETELDALPLLISRLVAAGEPEPDTLESPGAREGGVRWESPEAPFSCPSASAGHPV